MDLQLYTICPLTVAHRVHSAAFIIFAIQAKYSSNKMLWKQMQVQLQTLVQTSDYLLVLL